MVEIEALRFSGAVDSERHPLGIDAHFSRHDVGGAAAEEVKRFRTSFKGRQKLSVNKAMVEQASQAYVSPRCAAEAYKPVDLFPGKNPILIQSLHDRFV